MSDQDMASSRTLGVPELLDLIMTYAVLDRTRDVQEYDMSDSMSMVERGRILSSGLCMRRVCRTWKYIIDKNTVIQRALFLRPDHGQDRRWTMTMPDERQAGLLQNEIWKPMATFSHESSIARSKPRDVSSEMHPTPDNQYIFDISPSFVHISNPILVHKFPQVDFEMNNCFPPHLHRTWQDRVVRPQARFHMTISRSRYENWCQEQNMLTPPSPSTIAKLLRQISPLRISPSSISTSGTKLDHEPQTWGQFSASWTRMHLTSPPLTCPLQIQTRTKNDPRFDQYTWRQFTRVGGDPRITPIDFVSLGNAVVMSGKWKGAADAERRARGQVEKIWDGKDRRVGEPVLMGNVMACVRAILEKDAEVSCIRFEARESCWW